MGHAEVKTSLSRVPWEQRTVLLAPLACPWWASARSSPWTTAATLDTVTHGIQRWSTWGGVFSSQRCWNADGSLACPRGHTMFTNGFGIIVQDWGKGGSEEPHWAGGLRILEIHTASAFRTAAWSHILSTSVHHAWDTSLIRLCSPWPVRFLLSFHSTRARF